MSDQAGVPVPLQIEVVYALPEKQQLIQFEVEPGTCARDALNQVLTHKLLVIENTNSTMTPDALPIGVYGLQVEDDYVLKEGDRLEIYRPLLQDPKERRRQQARKG